MKKYSIFVLALVLTAALLVGCGCTNQNMGNTSEPTVLPTNEEVWTTDGTTEMTTIPTTTETMPKDTTEATIDHGNGPLDNTTATTATTEATAENRSRSGMLNQN